MRHKTNLLFALLTGMLLVACDGASSIIEEGANIYNPTSYSIEYDSVRRAEGYSSVMPSKGDVHVLVIPVTFADYPCSTLPGGCDGIKSEIQTTLFGTAGETGWESLTSYYEKSSYGQLHISGFVTDWFTSQYTALEIATTESSNPVSSMIAQKALIWYKATYNDNGKQFDSDSDGYIDAIWFVYSLDYNPTGNGMPEDSSVFWAFTGFNYGSMNLDNPGLFQYAWASYKFMYEDGYYERDADGYLIKDANGNYIFHNWLDNEGNILLDSHTFVHETGHLMGLDDYYTYDDVDWGAAGAVDMMDYNVGDHNAYSKALYGWTTPKVVTGSTKMTIKPFEENGDFLLLTPTYTETLCDEYLAIEFYTPTVLNEKDSIYPFAGYYPKTFSVPGIKVYHIDSRVARFRTNASGVDTLVSYTTVIGARSSSGYTGLAHSNTASRSGNPDLKLVHLLESSGENTFKHGGIATDDTLFTEGMTFGYDTFSNYTFNSGVALGYKFTVTSVTASGATLEIIKL